MVEEGKKLEKAPERVSTAVCLFATSVVVIVLSSPITLEVPSLSSVLHSIERPNRGEARVKEEEKERA